MITFYLPRRLTLLGWETEFGPRRGPVTADGSWSGRVSTDGLHLDFTKVEFADFGALARALLLLDSAVRSRVPAMVTLPTGDPTADEEQHLLKLKAEEHSPAEDIHRQMARRARSRGDVRAFMRHVGFLDALRAPHWPQGAVWLQDGGAIPRDEQPGEPLGTSTVNVPEPDPDDAPYRLRRIFPFQWFKPMLGERLRESESFHATVAGLSGLGMSRSDARALSQTVLTELVENVAEHAGAGESVPTLALVGAVLLDTETYALRRNDMPAQLGELVDCATTGGQILRLIVGDSGLGLIARLAPVQARHGTSSCVEYVGGRRPTDAEDTIFYAFDKWSTSGPEADAARQGMRGLWRVARVVRSYRGSVIVRTADAMAGLVYGKATGGSEIAGDGLGHAPGTLLEINILTDSQSRAPMIPWANQPAALGEHALRWVKCSVDPCNGLGDVDRSRLREAARLAYHDHGVIGLVATIPVPDATPPMTGAEMQEALHQILDSTSRIANPTPVVVVLPDADPPILDLSVTGLHVAEERASGGAELPRPHNPIMVLGAYGGPRWCGGSAPLRAVLDALSAAGGVLPMPEAEQCWLDAGGWAAALWPAMRDQEHLFRSNGDQLILRFSPVDVVKTLIKVAHTELADTIERYGVGVERGRFRTPMLRIVNRWIDVDQLLDGTIGNAVAAFILARGVEEVLRASSQPDVPVVVAQTATAPLSLVSQLSECLSLGGRCYPMPGELDLDDLPSRERVLSGAQVVLCTNLISTENSVRRAVAGIVGANAEPRVIVCVVDTREERGPVQLLTRTIPVVSLTEAAISVTDSEPGHPAEPVVDIDPILWRPRVAVRAPRSPILEAEILRWCITEPGTLRLGHIERSVHAHYSAYLNLDSLLRHSDSRSKIADTFLTVVRQALIDTLGTAHGNQLSDSPLELWHPGTHYDYAGILAAIISDRLTAQNIPVSALIPVPRWSAGDRWTFPARLDHDSRDRPVIIIDWGTLSATTLQQMIRLAANSGANCIVAVALLNQLDDQDAETLGMLRAVSANVAAPVQTTPFGDPQRTSPDNRVVPAVVRFVSASNITPLGAQSCAMCVARERYEMASESGPRRLRHHAERLRELLRPRSRREAFRDAPADLFTVPISGEDMADYIRWRGLLKRALRETSVRHEVINLLQTLTDEDHKHSWTRTNLLRLLAAEQQWLKLPPLRFSRARELLAENCILGLRKSVTTSPWLRAQALIVLSVTAPHRLVASMPELLYSVIDEAVLVDQLFLECHRLLQRSWRDSPIDDTRFRTSLRHCRDHLEETQKERNSSLVDDYLHVVKELITIADSRTRPRPEDAQTAWERLREDLWRPVIRHRLESDLLRVLGYVNDLEEVKPTTTAAHNARSDWENCARQLNERALINLPALRDIIAGEYVSDQLGKRDQQQLLQLTRSNVTALPDVTERLHRLIREPWRPEDPRWQALRRELLDRITWWYRLFLATHIPGGDAPALLVDLVSSAPIAPGTYVAGVLESHRFEATIEYRDNAANTQVFCPGKLLDQVIRHLLDNVRRHQIRGNLAAFTLSATGSIRSLFDW